MDRPLGAEARRDRKGLKALPLISCPSCGKTSFTFARRNYVAHCGGCGKPLTGEQDTTAIELEIREQLYGHRRDPNRPAVPTR